MPDTYCRELWRSFAINHRGEIYPCCHFKPEKLGNIRDNTLMELVNGDTYRKLRQASLDGTLECYNGCTWVRPIPLYARKTSTTIDYSELESLTIVFGEVCNIRCIMCRQRKREVHEVLSADMVAKAVDPTPFTSIFLSGGEPLLITECKKYMDILMKYGSRFGFSSNGMLIDHHFVETYGRYLMFATISINAATKETHEKVNVGSSFDRVLHNIEMLQEFKTRTGANYVVNGRMTLTVPALKEIPMFIQRFRQFGFDRINFGFDKDTVPPFLAKHPELWQKLREDVSAALRRIEDPALADIYRLCQLDLIESDQQNRDWWQI